MTDETLITFTRGASEIQFFGARADPTIAFGGWEFWDLLDWRGLPGSKGRQDDRPNAHGSFPTDRDWRVAKVISFRARFIGVSLEQTENAIDELAALGAELPVLMTVASPAGTTARLVRVSTIKPMDGNSRRFASVAINVTADDPLRYAPESEVPWQRTGPPSAGLGLVWPAVWPLTWPGGGDSGRVVLTNVGKAASAPVFRLQGGFSSALLTCAETGSRIGLDRPVPAGSVVEISVADRTATIDGQSDLGRWLRWREWELVPPGESRSFQFDVTDPSGSPILEGRVLSAWW